jgi:hypothetical protein
MLELCFSALIVLAMGFVNTGLDIIIFGFNIFIFIGDLITTLLLVLFTNWLCSINWYTLSWFLSIVIALITFMGLYLYRTKDPVFMKSIEDEKKKQTALIKTPDKK